MTEHEDHLRRVRLGEFLTEPLVSMEPAMDECGDADEAADPVSRAYRQRFRAFPPEAKWHELMGQPCPDADRCQCDEAREWRAAQDAYMYER
jgi:hypothetical protein